MIVVLIKRKNGSIYQASSFNTSIEKEIKSNPEDNALVKKIAKEFAVNPENVHKFWTA